MMSRPNVLPLRHLVAALVIVAVIVGGSLSARGQGNDWQAAVDALRETGGIVAIPCGRHVLPAPLRLWGKVTIQGHGPCTVLEGPAGQNIIETATPNDRQHYIAVRDLWLVGGGAGSYIGIDFRNVSRSHVRNVQVENVRVGVLLYLTAYYNVLEDVAVTEVGEAAFEILDGANENTVRGGRVDTAGYGLWVRNVSNAQVYGTSFENITGSAILVDYGAWATKVIGSRIEAANTGVNIFPNTRQSVFVGIYMTNVTVPRRINAAAGTYDYWWFGP
jgi:hypothetical protein